MQIGLRTNGPRRIIPWRMSTNGCACLWVNRGRWHDSRKTVTEPSRVSQVLQVLQNNDVLCHGNSKTVHSLVVASASFHNGIRQIPRAYKLLQKWKHPKTFKIFKAILVWRTIAVVSPKAGIFDCPTKKTVQQRCSAWQSSLQEAFWSYQGEITSAQVLGDFDKSQPSVIQSDASKNG